MTSWRNSGRIPSINSAGNNRATPPPPAGSRRMPANHKETAVSILLSAILLISYAGLLAVALILAVSVDNDDQE